MDKTALMTVKANLKKRQPKFIRQDAHKHKRVKQVWRRPKGLHSKMKDSRTGYRAKLQEGYRTPRLVRGLDKHGLLPTNITSLAQLAALDPKTHSLIIDGNLGGRKRLPLLEEAMKRKFTILNAKADSAAQLKARFASQQKEKAERTKEKSAKRKSLEEKAQEAEKKKEEKKDADEEKDTGTPDKEAESKSENNAKSEEKKETEQKQTKEQKLPAKTTETTKSVAKPAPHTHK